MNRFQQRRIGRTDLQVSVLGLGGAPLGDLYEYRRTGRWRRWRRRTGAASACSIPRRSMDTVCRSTDLDTSCATSRVRNL